MRILEQHGISLEVIEYLENPPNKGELQAILAKLDLPVRALLRNSESEYETESLADESLDEDDLLTAISHHPILLQRPIVVAQNKAVIARPPSKVLEII